MRRAEEAGFQAIVLTVDTPLPSPKERDLRNRYQRKTNLATSGEWTRTAAPSAAPMRLLGGMCRQRAFDHLA